jgi:hypothetical protein
MNSKTLLRIMRNLIDINLAPTAERTLKIITGSSVRGLFPTSG